jgi:hypothetical protein
MVSETARAWRPLPPTGRLGMTRQPAMMRLRPDAFAS